MGRTLLDEPIPEHDLEPLPFIYNLELTETEQFSDAPSIENPVQLTEAPTPSPAELLAQEHLSAVDGNASEAVEIPTEVDLEEHDQKIVAFLESPEGFAGGEISDSDDPLEGFLPAVEQHSTPLPLIRECSRLGTREL